MSGTGSPGPERTADGRHIVVDGRRWRATDPELPGELAAALRRELGRARSAIGRSREAEETARLRGRVQVAKEGLGERGPPGGSCRCSSGSRGRRTGCGSSRTAEDLRWLRLSPVRRIGADP